MVTTVYSLRAMARAVVSFFARSFALGQVTPYSFSAANGAVHPTLGSVSIAASWTWVIALLFIPGVAYRLGIIAFIPFVGMNTLVLVAIGLAAPRIRVAVPEGISLPQFAGVRDGKVMEYVLAAITLVIMTYAIILALTGTHHLVRYLGVPQSETMTAMWLIAALVYAVSFPRGIQSSIAIDMLKIGAIVLLVGGAIAAIAAAGGIGTLWNGAFAVRTGQPALTSSTSVGVFVAAASISLFASAFTDGMLFQRLFSVQKGGERRAFMGAPLIFVWVPFLMACIGLVGYTSGVKAPHPDLVGFTTIVKFLPGLSEWVLALVLAAAILATAVAALNAAGTVAMKHFIAPAARLDSTDHGAYRYVQYHRIIMGLVLLFATCSLYLEWGLLKWWLTAGAVRSVVLVPLLAIIFWNREDIPSVRYWLLVTIPAGVLFWYYASIDAALLAAFTAGVVCLVVNRLRAKFA